MRVLVTGAGSAIGGHLACALAVRGFDVIAMTRKSAVMPPGERAARERFTVATGDLADGQALPAALDAVVHVAGTSPGPGVTSRDIARDNVQATRLLIQHALASGAGAFVFFSSLAAFGRISDTLVGESTPVVNPDAYGLSKLLVEAMLTESADRLPAIALRLPGVIGPGAHRNWLASTLEALRRHDPVSVYRPEAPFNNAVHVADLSRFVGSLLSQGLRGFDAIVLGADGRLTIRDVVARLAAGSDSQSPITVRDPDRTSFVLDWRRARQQYAYEAMDIGAMLDRFVLESTPAFPGTARAAEGMAT